MNKKDFTLLSILVVVLITMFSLFIFYKNNTDRFLGLFQNYFMYAYSQDFISSFCVFFVLHAPYHIFLLPGYTLFAIAAGFFLQDLMYTFTILFIGKFLTFSECNLDIVSLFPIQIFI